MRDKTFYIVCIGFLLGTACRSFVFLDEYFISFLFLLAFSIYIIHRKVLIPIFLISLAFGVLRFHLSDKSPSLNFEEKVGLEQTYTGQIVLEPDIRANNQKITVLITEEKENSLLTQDKGSLVTEKTKVLVTVSLEESLQSGEEIILRGKLQKPENFSFSEESERYFDYISYF